MDGIIRIWAAVSGDLIREVDGNHMKGDAIMAMKLDVDYQRLVTADAHGYVKVWKFDNKSLDVNWNHRITPLYHWKAHDNAVTSIDIIKTNGSIVTSSSDLRVNLWAFDGAWIGTFGQPSTWNALDLKTYHNQTAILLPLYASSDLNPEETLPTVPEDESTDEEKEENITAHVERQPSFKVDSGGRRILAIHDLTPIPEHIPYSERSKLSSHKSNPTIFQSDAKSGDMPRLHEGAKTHVPRVSIDIGKKSGALTERGRIRDTRDGVSVRLPSITTATREEDLATSRYAQVKGRRESNLRVCDELNISPRVVRHKSNSVPEMLQTRISSVTALASKTISRIRDLDESNLPPALKPPVERPHLANLLGKREDSTEELSS